MAGMTWRRRFAVATAAIAAVVTMAACGSEEPADTSATQTSDTGQLGGAPTTPAGVTTTQPGDGGNGGQGGDGGNGGGNGGGGGNDAPTYPDNAADYAVAFMKAVSANDTARIKSLAEQAAVLQATGGHGTLRGGWTMYSCSSADANNMIGCTVRNTDGDDARITIRGSQLGSVAAVTSVQLDLTTYPNDPVSYVAEMLTAKGNDNKQRVAHLSTSTMFSKLTCYIAGQQNPPPEPIDGTYTKVTISGIGADYGKSYEFKVLTKPGGKANAVKALLSVSC